MPKRRKLPDESMADSIPHVTLRAPLVIIANSVLQITGYSHFTRRVAPLVSAGSLHGLALGAVGIYEVFCSQIQGRFDVLDAKDTLLTSVADVTRFPENKRAVFGAFFDMRKIDEVCEDYGLIFANRITYVDPFTIHLTGKVIPSDDRLPAISRFEARKKRNRGNPSGSKWSDEFLKSGMTKEEVEQKTEEASTKIKFLENEIKPLRKSVSRYQTIQTTVGRDLRVKESGPATPNSSTSTTTYEALYNARQELRAARLDLNPKEVELRRCRQERYFWNNLLKAARSPHRTSTNDPRPGDITVPVWAHPAVEDATEHLDVGKLVEEHGKVIKARRGGYKEHRLAFAGTDYGICKMSETVPQTLGEIQVHLNRYQALANLYDPDDDDQNVIEVEPPASISSPHVVSNESSKPLRSDRAETLASLKLPNAFTITAPRINESSSTRKLEHRRRGRLRKQKEVQQALLDVGSKDQRMSDASTVNDVENAQKGGETTGRDDSAPKKLYPGLPQPNGDVFKTMLETNMMAGVPSATTITSLELQRQRTLNTQQSALGI
ncbi:hypothetical protein BGZ65_008945, partial [Modicella reniformis]